MGRHRLKHHTEGSSAEDRKATGAVDAENRDMVEPDRNAQDRLPAEEREARLRVHTDRDPEDDIHLAAADRQETNRSQ